MNILRFLVWVVGLALVGGCVSKGAYLRQAEALQKSLEMNQRCQEHVEWLEVENRDLREKNNGLMALESVEMDDEYKGRIEAYLKLNCLCKHKAVLKGQK